MPPADITISMVQSAVSVDTKDAGALAIVEAIRDGKWQKTVEDIRNRFQMSLKMGGTVKAAKEAIATQKKNLPGVCFSGTFNRRADDAIVGHSGLLCADLDDLGERVESIRSQLLLSRHLWALFLSPTGNGLKAVFRVVADEDKHRASFHAVEKHVKGLTGEEIDQKCKNLSRLCFVSYDPETFINLEATELKPLETPAPSPVVVAQSRKQIAESLLAGIEWKTETEGFCFCPGQAMHTNTNAKTDCRVCIDRAPTIYCVHQACASVIAALNRDLRSRIGKAEKTAGKLLMSHVATNGAPPAPVAEAEPTLMNGEIPAYSEFKHANKLEALLPPTKTFGKEWFCYNAGAWMKVDPAAIRPTAQSVISPFFRTAKREQQLISHLEGRLQGGNGALVGFYRFDEAGNVLLNVANGVLRVSKDSDPALLPHDQKYGFTLKTTAKYDPLAKFDLFQRIMGEALPDSKDVQLLQLFAGYCLLPDCRFEAALVCFGESGAGKSTIAEIMAGALGSGLVQRLSMGQICDGKSYSLPKLKFAAVNLGTELDAVELDDSANFKVIVSGEEVEAREIYGSPFAMQTAAKLWFLTNGIPRFKHGTDAELRRTRFIRFGIVPAEKARDVTLKFRLQQEKNGVFLFMVEGLQALLKRGDMPMGGAESVKVHERFKVTNDPLAAFVAQRCIMDGEAVITLTTLQEAYRSFCDDYGLSVHLGPIFCRMLYDRFPKLRSAQSRDNDGSRVRAVHGLLLKTEA